MSVYDGVDGLQAAWERFKYWLNIELPDQWQQIAALLAALGAPIPGSSAAQAVDSSLVTDDPYAAWRADKLSSTDQAWAGMISHNWQTVWGYFHNPIPLGPWTDWPTNPPNRSVSAVLLIGWRMWHHVNGTVYTAAPEFSYPPSDATEWLPGMPGGN